MMMIGEKLCLQWNDFKENTTSAFSQLREDGEFADVTLACEDGQQIEAHKVVLISSSPFFRNLLSKNKHPHPLIYMRGVEFEQLSALMDFLYLGEANVLQENIESFLTIATELKFKGLSGKAENHFVDGKDAIQPTRAKKAAKDKKIPTATQMVKQIEDIDQKPPIEKTITLANQNRVDADMERLDEQIDSMITTTDKSDPKSGKLVACKLCGKEGARSHVGRHIESKHIAGVSHKCDICGKTAR